MQEQPLELGYGRPAPKAQLVAAVFRFFDLLVRKWWVLVLGGGLGLGIEALLLWGLPPSYYSVGQMIVNTKITVPEGGIYTEELNNYLPTQVALMESRAVADRAAERAAEKNPQAPRQPVKLKVSTTPKTSIFVLEASGRHGPYVQDYLQACMEEYTQLKRAMRKQTSDTTLSFMTEEALRVQEMVKKCEQDLLDFENSNTVVLLPEQGNTVANYLATLNQRLSETKSEYELLRTLTLDQNVERRQELTPPAPTASNDQTNAPPATSATQREKEYLQAKQQILLMKAELEDLGKYLKPKHPKVIALKEEIVQRENLLEILRQQSADQLETRKIATALQIANLEKDVKEWDAKNLDTSRKMAEYQKLKAVSQRTQAMNDRLLATMQSLDMNKEINAEGVTIMEKASPAVLDDRNNVRNLCMAGLACVVLSLGLLLFLDRLDDRLNSLSELEELFTEPVLGQIPKERATNKGGQIKLIEMDDQRHSFLEAYRSLRSSLLFASEISQRAKVLAVTSSIPNDGKSLTTSNLAIVMASSGARVLLVDADLRKGVQHERFGITVGPGLSEVLSEGADWREAVKGTKYANLFLLQRGQHTHCSGELFLSAATKNFLKETAAEYEYVILDTPPVMAADDVTSLAPHVHGVLFVIRADKTSARVARAALELIYQRRATVLGIIFNSVRPSSGDYYYYYNYKNYYKTYPADSSAKGRKSA